MLLHRLRNQLNRSLRPMGFEVRRVEPEIPAAFAAQIELTQNSAPVIFDIGANVGDVSLFYRKLFPSSTLHAFEPFPENFRALARQCAGLDRVFANQLAVSDQVGTSTFHSNVSSLTNSMLATDATGAGYWPDGYLQTTSTLEVPTTTIDAYCEEHHVSTVDILKLDIQGAELLALHGARGMLGRAAVKLIYLEVLTAPSYVGQPQLEDYLRWLRTFGYLLLDIYNSAHKGLRLTQADLIFVPEKGQPVGRPVNGPSEPSLIP